MTVSSTESIMVDLILLEKGDNQELQKEVNSLNT